VPFDRRATNSKTRRRNMVAFIDNHVPIVCDEVRDFALTHKALNQRDINNAGRSALATADASDSHWVDIEESFEAFYPLSKQFSAVDENERISCPQCDQRCGDNRLAESGRSRQNAVVIWRQRFVCLDLRP